MIKRLLPVLFFLFLLFPVFPASVSGQEYGTPPPDAPLCGGLTSPECVCSYSRYLQGLEQPADCWCPVPEPGATSFCSDWPDVRLWVSGGGGSGLSTPVFVTATPRPNQELFPVLDDGCPDWSYLGPGTVTPAPDDVSADYALRCRACLADGSLDFLPTPVVGAISTPLPDAGLGDDWYLASSVDDSWPYSYLLTVEKTHVGRTVHLSWAGSPELAGRDVIGVLLGWHAVTGVTCDVRVDSTLTVSIPAVDAWLDSGNDYCFGPADACREFLPDGGVYAGSANVLYGSSAQINLEFGPVRCEGSYQMPVDLILRDHKPGGIPVFDISLSTPTPVPAPTATQVPAVAVFTGPQELSDGATASISSSGLVATGSWYVPASGVNDYRAAIWRIGISSSVAIRSIKLWLRPAGGELPTDNWGGCPVNVDTVWRPKVYFAAGSLYYTYDLVSRQSWKGGYLFHYQKGWDAQISHVGGGENRVRSCTAKSDVPRSFRWELWIVEVNGVEYPSEPTPTPTPVLTPTPVWSGVGDYCGLVEWRTEEERLGLDFLDFEWSGWFSEPECFTVLPEVSKTIPLDKIPFVGLEEVNISWPGFQLCIRWIEFPRLSILSVPVSLDWFLLPVVLGLVGLIVRS